MGYAFRADGRLAGRDLKRIAREQIGKLQTKLDDAQDGANGHLEARKCIKRLRALFMLVRPAVGPDAWYKLDRVLASLGHDMAAARDQTVNLQTLDLLEETHGPALVAPVRHRLRMPAKSTNGAGHLVATRAQLTTKISKLSQQIAKLPLGDVEAAGLLRGLEADYRSGLGALAKARASATAPAYHRLRKRIQRHWRQLRLFAAPWPQDLAPRIELARTIAAQLGEDQDLWMLCQALTAAESELAQLCISRQDHLRAAIQAPLSLLYAESPKALRRRLQAYWDAAGVVEAWQSSSDAGREAASASKRKPSRRHATSEL